MTTARRCKCGHSLEAHEHFRAGRDCSACLDGGCRRFAQRRALSFAAVLPRMPWSRVRSVTR